MATFTCSLSGVATFHSYFILSLWSWGAQSDVVLFNYDDVLHNYAATAYKFISMMSVVTVISVIAAISQSHN